MNELTDNEQLEAAVTERIAELQEFARKMPDHVDARWVAIARTQMELGFLALNRAIIKTGKKGP